MSLGVAAERPRIAYQPLSKRNRQAAWCQKLLAYQRRCLTCLLLRATTAIDGGRRSRRGCDKSGNQNLHGHSRGQQKRSIQPRYDPLILEESRQLPPVRMM